MKSFLSLFAVLLLASACSETGDSASAHPAVGILKSNGYEVTLHSAEDGPRYTLVDKSGKTLAQELTRSDLATRFPKIHEEIVGLWAGNDLKNGVPIDSPVNLPATPAPFQFEKVEVENGVEIKDLPEIPVK